VDVHLVALQQIARFSEPCAWALVLDDVLGRAVQSLAVRAALRELLAQVDAACVCVDVAALSRHFSTLLSLEPDVAAVRVGGEPEVASPKTARVPVPRRALPEAAAGSPARTANEAALFEQMRSWRRDEARRRGVPAFRVMSDRVLTQVCREKPRDLSTLGTIPGIGQKTLAESGKGLLEAIAHAAGG
jgi:superfamily II DNA helicase RecQ